jgi:hypothetical protein
MYSFTACQCQVQAGVQECGASQGCLQGCVWFVSNRIHISQYYHLIYICYIFYASKLQNGVYCVMIYGIVPPFVKAMSGSDVMWIFLFRNNIMKPGNAKTFLLLFLLGLLLCLVSSTGS